MAARGQIVKRPRKDGSIGYFVRVELPADPSTGERRRKTGTFDTEKEAEKARTRWLSEVDEGNVVLPSKITMRDLLRRWLRDEAAHRVRPTTLVGYEITVEKHLIPALGNKQAQSLTTADVLEVRSKLVAAGKARTAQVAMLRLRQCLAWAVSVGLLARNVSATVKRPTAKAPERRTWDASQARTFLDTAQGDGYSPLWLVLLTTGLRRGEALGLRWRDIDFDRGTLSVRQSVVLHNGAPHIQLPKSKASLRTVRLPKGTLDALRQHRDRQTFKRKAAAEWADHDLVFATRQGKPINPRHVLRSFYALVKRADVPKISIHDLRHTSATLMLKSGVPVKVVSERLGHAQASITLDTYAHVLPDMQEAAVEAIDAALTG